MRLVQRHKFAKGASGLVSSGFENSFRFARAAKNSTSDCIAAPAARGRAGKRNDRACQIQRENSPPLPGVIPRQSVHRLAKRFTTEAQSTGKKDATFCDGISLPISVFSVPSVLKAFRVNARRTHACGRPPPLRNNVTMRSKHSNHNKYTIKSEFALTGRGLRKYKKLYLKTVSGTRFIYSLDL